MGNVLKGVATGGLSFLPRKAQAVATGGMSELLQPQVKQQPQVGPMGLALGGNPGYEEGPAGPAGLISKMVQAPGYGNPLSQAPTPVAAPQETPRQRAARQAAQKAARGNPPPTPAPIGYPPQPLPLEHPRSLPIQKTNPVEVRRGGGMVTNRGF